MITSVAVVIGVFLSVGVLTHVIEPEQGTAIGSIATATLGVVAYVFRRPAPEAIVMGLEEGGAAPALK